MTLPRRQNSAISVRFKKKRLIDTTLLLAGALAAAVYFDDESESEQAIRDLADAIYRRIDWQWALGGEATARQGRKPESGFLHYGWEGYSEAIILCVLALASPSHPLPDESFTAWTSTYRWENIYDCEFLYAGPLFIHQFSQAWIDFAGIRDRYMRAKGSDYFENSRKATHVQREYARRNPHGFEGYGKDCWGLTANEGPGFRTLRIGGRSRSFLGYAARGVPYGPTTARLVHVRRSRRCPLHPTWPCPLCDTCVRTIPI